MGPTRYEQGFLLPEEKNLRPGPWHQRESHALSNHVRDTATQGCGTTPKTDTACWPRE